MTLGLEPIVDIRAYAHPGPRRDTRPATRIRHVQKRFLTAAIIPLIVYLVVNCIRGPFVPMLHALQLSDLLAELGHDKGPCVEDQ